MSMQDLAGREQAMSSTRGKSSDIRHPRDSYQTPPWVCDAWAERAALVAEPYYAIVDLGCGDGRISIKVAYESGTELSPIMVDVDPIFRDVEPLDYMDPSVDPAWLASPEKPVLFVSNPPFSLSTEFVQKTVEALPVCFLGSAASFLLRLNWYGSKRRADWINAHPPGAITGLAPRPSFTGCGTDSCEYALFWWFRDEKPAELKTFEIATRPGKGRR